MELRKAFGEDPRNYDRWRPRYCPELFSSVIQYAGLSPQSYALEIGIGTGQATEPILQTGSSVKAVELDETLCRFVAEKFRENPRFSVVHGEFEAWEAKEEAFDLVYSATAFHWIPPQTGYPKLFRLLKKGGAVALFWNRPFASRMEDAVHRRIQAVYQKYRPSPDGPPKEDAEALYRSRQEWLRKYGFIDVKMEIFHGTRRFSAEEYVRLLNTYSDHRAMQPKIKAVFEQEIREAICREGGSMTVYDTMDLHLGRRP